MDEVRKRRLGVLLVAVGFAFVAGYALKEPAIDTWLPSRAPSKDYSVATMEHLVSGRDSSGVSNTVLTTIEISSMDEVAIGGKAGLSARFDQFELADEDQQLFRQAATGPRAVDGVTAKRLKTAKAPLKITMSPSGLDWYEAYPIRTIRVGDKLRMYHLWSPRAETAGPVTVTLQVDDEDQDLKASTEVTSKTFVVQDGVRIKETNISPITFRVLGKDAIPDDVWAWLTMAGSMLAFVGASTLFGWGRGLLHAIGIRRAE